MRSFLLISLFTFIGVICQAQVTKYFIDPVKQYNQAAEKITDEKYSEALDLLSLINENDSIYRSSIALTFQALYYDEKYDKILTLCEKHDSVKDEYYRQIAIYKAVSLIQMEKYNEAVEFLSELKEYYPKNYLIWYNLGVAYELEEEYEKAIQAFQKSIIYNAYYAPPHLKLGNICYKNHNISQALICWDMYLLINPTGDNSVNVLIMADKAVSSKPEEEPIGITVSPDDESFKNIDLLINNYVALNSDYKVPAKINASFVKQNYALLEMLKTYESKDGFWSQKYVPLFLDIAKMNYFEPFVYRMIQSSGSKSHQKAVKKSAKQRSEFVNWLAPQWESIAGSNNPDTKKKYFYNSTGELLSEGDKDNTGYYKGEVTFYQDGRVSAIGSFEGENRAGKWKWYDEFGNLSEELFYNNQGKPDGPYIKYYTNGNIKSSYTLKDNVYEGEYALYNEFGFLTEKGTYKNDYYNGVRTTYHALGEGFPDKVVKFDEGNPADSLFNYFPDGTPGLKVKFADGYRIGKEYQYFPNGKLSYEYTYGEEGKLDGEYKSYYLTGNIHQSGQYKNDKQTGLWKYYYPDGKINYEIEYEDGKYQGRYVYYEYSYDHPSYEYVYDQDVLMKYTVWDRKGNVLSETENSGGKFFYEGYSSGGVKASAGYFNKKGKRTGTWQFYDEYGSLDSKETYIDGKLKGTDTAFYTGGAVYSLTNYIDGKAEGIYKEFYPDGSLKSIGNYKNNVIDRIWYFYYPDGTTESIYYYKKGIMDGYQYDYSVDGKLYSRDYYKDGLSQYTDFYDTLGNVYERVGYYPDTTGTSLFKNGKPEIDYHYIDGYKHGMFTWYYSNGKINVKGAYFMGDPVGEWKWYYDNGQLQTKGTYEYGNQAGEWISYYENGKIETKKSFNESYVQSGPFESYNDDGFITLRGIYLNGYKHGEFLYYSNKGELQLARYYDYDELVGYSYPDENNNLLPMIPIDSGTVKIQAYYPNGQISRDLSFYRGKFHGPYIEYYSNGQIESKDTYEYGIKNGESIGFYSNGQVKYKANVLMDEYHGTYTEYYEDGTLKEKSEYRNGKANGPAVFYKPNGKTEKEIWYFNGSVYDAKYY